jgi:predicted HTH domain antitoxin
MIPAHSISDAISKAKVLLENDNAYDLCKGEFIREIQYPDAEHIMVHYVNVSKADNTPFGELMQDFLKTDCNQMKNQIFKEIVQYYKNTKGGYNKMKSVSEQIYNEGYNEGKNEGRNEGREYVAKSLLQQKLLSLQQIAEVTGISIERLIELKNEII